MFDSQTQRNQIKFCLLFFYFTFVAWFVQAMWNYIIDSGNVVGALGEDEADYISGDILEYLGEFT